MKTTRKAYLGRQEQRQDQYTPEFILGIAERCGRFSVTLRYRDHWLKRRCVKLRQAGKLRGGHKIIQGQYVFYPATQVPAPVEQTGVA